MTAPATWLVELHGSHADPRRSSILEYSIALWDGARLHHVAQRVCGLPPGRTMPRHLPAGLVPALVEDCDPFNDADRRLLGYPERSGAAWCVWHADHRLHLLSQHAFRCTEYAVDLTRECRQRWPDLRCTLDRALARATGEPYQPPPEPDTCWQRVQRMCRLWRALWE